VRGHLLGVTAAPEQADHPGTAVGAAHELRTRDQRQLLRREVAVLRLVRVGVVDAGRADGEQLLAVPRLRVGQVDDVEDLRPAEAGDLHGSHPMTLGRAGPRVFPPALPCAGGELDSPPTSRAPV
jgi:hypothetical protein